MKLKKFVSAIAALSMFASVCTNDLSVVAAAGKASASTDTASQQQATTDTNNSTNTGNNGVLNMHYENADGPNHKIRLWWDGTATTQHRYDYKVFGQEKGKKLETLGVWDGVGHIYVLNVYPTNASATRLTDWMGPHISEAEDLEYMKQNKNNPYYNLPGKGRIHVKAVSLEDYNNDPVGCQEITEAGPRYKDTVDVIMFGSEDKNGQPTPGDGTHDLNEASYKATADFGKTGRGVLFGHDTVSPVTCPIFCRFACNEKKTPQYKNVLGCTLADPCDGTWTACNTINYINKGFLTLYPWELCKEKVLDIPLTHCLGQFTGGNNPATVWMKFKEKHYTMGDASDDAYLFTNENYGMIQTGHSNAETTTDEKHVLANTLFYLKHVTNETYIYSHQFLDNASPSVPSVQPVDSASVSLSSTDAGTDYSYYVEACPRSPEDKPIDSDTVNATALAGMKGFVVRVSDSKDPEKEPKLYREDGTLISPILPAKDGKLVYNYSKDGQGLKYLHVFAVDNLENVSSETVYPVTIKPTSLSINNFKNTAKPSSLDFKEKQVEVQLNTGFDYTAYPNYTAAITYTLQKDGVDIPNQSNTQTLKLTPSDTKRSVTAKSSVLKINDITDSKYTAKVHLRVVDKDNKLAKELDQVVNIPVNPMNFKLNASATTGIGYKVNLNWDDLNDEDHAYSYKLSSGSEKGKFVGIDSKYIFPQNAPSKKKAVTDSLFKDKAAPTTPNVNANDLSKVQLSASDNGTNYYYCVEADPVKNNNDDNNKKNRITRYADSELVTAKSELKGFIVGASRSKDAMTNLLTRNSKGEITADIKEATNGSAQIDASDYEAGTWYLHVFAVDNDNNVSSEAIKEIYIKPVKEIKMSTTPATVTLKAEEEQKLSLNTTVNYTVNPALTGILYYRVMENDKEIDSWTSPVSLKRNEHTVNVKNNDVQITPNLKSNYQVKIELYTGDKPIKENLVTSNNVEVNVDETPVKKFVLSADVKTGKDYHADLTWTDLDDRGQAFDYEVYQQKENDKWLTRSTRVDGAEVSFVDMIDWTALSIKRANGEVTTRDQLFLDDAAPEVKAVDPKDISKVKLSATDNGTKYSYYIGSLPRNKKLNGRTTDPVKDLVALSEVQGFIVGISDTKDAMPDLVERDENDKLIHEIKAADGGVAYIDVKDEEPGQRYLHVYAVDNADNVSEEMVQPVFIPNTVQIHSMKTIADNYTLSAPGKQTISLHTNVKYTVKPNCKGVLKCSLFEDDRTVSGWHIDVELDRNKNDANMNSTVGIDVKQHSSYKVKVEFYTKDETGKETLEKSEEVPFLVEVKDFTLGVRTATGKNYSADLSWNDLETNSSKYSYLVYQVKEDGDPLKRGTCDEELGGKDALTTKRSDGIITTRDKLFLDEAAPEKPAVNPDVLKDVKLSSTDNATNYKYYVEGVAHNTNLKRSHWTQTVDKVAARSEVKGFIVGISTSQDAMSDLVKRDQKGNLISKIQPAEDGKASIDVSDEEPGLNYLHVYAVDNAGNVSGETVQPVVIPRTVEIYSMKTVADKYILQAPGEQTVNFNTNIKYRVKPDCKGIVSYRLFQDGKQIKGWQREVTLDRTKNETDIASKVKVDVKQHSSYELKVDFYTLNETEKASYKLEKSEVIPFLVEAKDFELKVTTTTGTNYSADLSWNDLETNSSEYNYLVYQQKENGDLLKRGTGEQKFDGKSALTIKKSDGVVTTRDNLFLDEAAPEKPMVTIEKDKEKNEDILNAVQLSSKDMATNYTYFVDGIAANTKLKNRRTQQVDKAALSELKGFIVAVNKNENPMPELVKRDENGNFVEEIKPAKDGAAYIDVSQCESGTEYIHVYAVDNAGNVSKETVQPVEVPKEYFNTSYSMFASNDDVSINCNTITIDGDVYGKEAVTSHANAITIKGTAWTSGKLSIGGNQISVGHTKIEKEPLPAPQYMDHILVNMKAAKHVPEIFYSNDNEIDEATICEGTFKAQGQNLNIYASVVADSNISLDPNAVLACGKEGQPVVVASKKGDITIGAQEFNGAGLIYAPNGTVTITSKSINYKGSIIAKKIVLQGTTYNISKSDEKY